MDDNFEQAKYAFTQPYHYGYSVFIENDVRPMIGQYGTPVPDLITSDVSKPFVDEIIDKNNNTLKLVAEMPGVDKKDIKVTLEGKCAKISAERGERKYYTQIPIKYKIDENSSKATYTNGILEVSLRLIEQKPKEKTISVD